MEIYIDTDRARHSVKIFVFEETQGKRVCYYYDGGELKTVEHDIQAVSFMGKTIAWITATVFQWVAAKHSEWRRQQGSQDQRRQL